MILLASTMERTFILEDLKILQEAYEVEFYRGSGINAPHHFFHKSRRSNLAISWFASVYSLFLVLGARFSQSPSIIIVGGADAAALPELGYGLWLHPWKGKIVRAALRRADLILTVDEALLDSLRRLSGLPLPQGRVLPTGYDPAFWKMSESEIERSGLLCVASCDSRLRGLVKGVDLFCEAAAARPDLNFTFVGASAEALRSFGFETPANLTVHPELGREELRSLYQTTDIYLQTSRHEGLPNVLCEAMLCGAVPVATDVGGSRRAVGECGVVVPSEDLSALLSGIDQGLSLSDVESARTNPRDHIASTFPLERRRRELLALVAELLGRSSVEVP